MPIEWSEAFSTSEPKLDDQHRQLFRFANKLEQLAHAGHPPREEIDRLLNFFEPYAKTHFLFEETCMHARRCPAAKANREAHLAFIKFFDESAQRLRADGYSQEWLEEMNSFVQRWLRSHICAIDAQLRDSPPA